MKDDQGWWVDSSEGLKDLLTTYFNHLYTLESNDSKQITWLIKPKVTKAQNLRLLQLFEPLEVREALFSMHLDKSPGPDRFNPGFFQSHWDVVGNKVTYACLDFLRALCLQG